MLIAMGALVTAMAVIIMLLTFTLNPVTQAPFIGLSWGGSLMLLFAADVFIYFNYELRQ